MDSGHLRTLRMGVDDFKSGRDRRGGGSQHGKEREVHRRERELEQEKKGRERVKERVKEPA